MQYGLIGEHLGHSYSREIHDEIAGYQYELQELRPEEVGPFLVARSFRAINVTIPYKETVIPYMDEISATARAIGAVNTIVNVDGRLIGHNTDFAGMRAMILRAGVVVEGAKVLILGTGGTSKTARAVCESLKARQIVTVSRRAQDGAVTYEDAYRDHSDAQVIVNATPVGMFPRDEGTPIDISRFPALRGAVDAVYHPLRTNFVLDARERGIPACGGLYMLAAQAVFASALFQGKELPSALIDKAFRLVERKKENLVLIGMPTSGKTTVGKLLAERAGKAFVDTDELITNRIGCPIAQFIPRQGEARFRAIEREVICAASQRDGCVIATGGGAVLDPANVRALRHNGVIYFLDRSLENLVAAPDRPLSSDPEKLWAMFAARRPLYLKAADAVVNADQMLSRVVEAIMREAEK